ncbi:hypothetical protein EW146_g10403 [Bondarzewia mesenterica]|uniref:Uncharacterized protein n=1 Tax=Bondarzewia mesenterica TaxID=1095465 RepID=A0A4S4KXG1_9AGAM|nr:hypothetical protein EW146_g10403 [Bondarzewia mesenterica]
MAQVQDSEHPPAFCITMPPSHCRSDKCKVQPHSDLGIEHHQWPSAGLETNIDSQSDDESDFAFKFDKAIKEDAIMDGILLTFRLTNASQSESLPIIMLRIIEHVNKERVVVNITTVQACEELFERDQDLRDRFSAATITGKWWNSIRSHPMLRGAYDQQTSTRREFQTNASMRNVEYQGNWHRLLKMLLDHMNMGRAYADSLYTNFVPITQSSGTGKSRTVDEMAKLVFALPFSLHSWKDETGHPLPDIEVRDVLTTPAPDSDALALNYYCFLANLFEAVHATVEPMEPRASYEEFAFSWRSYLVDQSSRENLYRRSSNLDTLENRPTELYVAGIRGGFGQAP